MGIGIKLKIVMRGEDRVKKGHPRMLAHFVEFTFIFLGRRKKGLWILYHLILRSYGRALTVVAQIHCVCGFL